MVNEYKFDPLLESCVKEVLEQSKEVFRIARTVNAMVTPIRVVDVLAEASRIYDIRKVGRDLTHMVAMDKELGDR